MLEDKCIVCIAPNQWEGIWRRRQQLMSRFAGSNRVLYVEPARFWLFALFSRGGLASLMNGRFSFRQEDLNLYILSQHLIFPFETVFLRSGISLIKRLNDRFNVWMLKKTLKRLDFKHPILWVYYTPRSESFIGNCGEGLVVCDVYDRYSAYPYFTRHPWLKERTDRLEAALIAKADVVFACSDPLYDYCERFNSRVHLVPNGADTSLANEAPPVANELVDIPHPILGYVGAIFDKLDFRLLNTLADAHPEWSLLMVGPLGVYSDEDKIQITSLREKKNVFFVGSKKNNELPRYYAAIDVALMPYKLTEHTEHISPLKMFEYMAFRKPTVSTDIPAARQFCDIISIAHGGAQLAENIGSLLNEKDGQRIQRGFEIAQQNSWDHRVKAISDIVNTRLNEKSR